MVERAYPACFPVDRTGILPVYFIQIIRQARRLSDKSPRRPASRPVLPDELKEADPIPGRLNPAHPAR